MIMKYNLLKNRIIRKQENEKRIVVFLISIGPVWGYANADSRGSGWKKILFKEVRVFFLEALSIELHFSIGQTGPLANSLDTFGKAASSLDLRF